MSLEPSTDRTADRVLVLLLCTDAIVIVIHFLHIGTIYYGSKGYSLPIRFTPTPTRARMGANRI